MPDKEELEILLDANGERSLAEFPDDDAWEALKAEIESQYAMPEGDDPYGDR
ncbi:MAG: hypothetical protein K5859_03705 [Atopobiaceae bacterium]|nr:hypothetical protein [Atopobiaceae bacterium]